MVIKTESPGKIGSNDGQMQRATSGALGGCVRVIQTYEKVSLACRLGGGERRKKVKTRRIPATCNASTSTAGAMDEDIRWEG